MLVSKDMDEGKSVLIVDDDPQVVGVMREYFEQEYANKGFTIRTASNGSAALEAIRANRPTLLLLDVEMPGRSGIEVLKEIRALDPDLPIIMITGNETLSVAGQIMSSGATAFLPKPVTFAYLDHIVGSILTKRSGR